MVAVLCGVSVVTVIDVVVVVVVGITSVVVAVFTATVVEMISMQALHNTGQFDRTRFPTNVSSLHAATVCVPSRPHSWGSPLPLHDPVVVVLVVLVSVAVVVDVVEDVHGSPT